MGEFFYSYHCPDAKGYSRMRIVSRTSDINEAYVEAFVMSDSPDEETVQLSMVELEKAIAKHRAAHTELVEALFKGGSSGS